MAQGRGTDRANSARPAGSEAPARLADLLPAGTLLIAGLCALQIAAFSTGGVPGQYLVIAAPGASEREAIRIVADAQGGLQDVTRLQNVVVASSKAPDFPSKLHAAGAWLVLPSPVKTGCFNTSSGEIPQ